MNFSNELSTTPNLFTNATSNSSLTGFPTYWIYTSVHIIGLTLGLPLNSYVFWLILMGKGSGVVLEFFRLNLTLCEMVFCLSGLVYILTDKFPELLSLAYYLGGLPFFGRPLFLCLICVERYVAVLFPVTFLKFKPLRYRLTCSAVVWVTVLGLSGLFVSVASTKNKYMFICSVLTLYSLILSIKLFCCFSIVRALKYPGPGQEGNEKEKANHMKRRAVTVIVILTVAMAIQYSPVFVAGLLFGALSMECFNILWTISCTVSLFIGYIHPFLYIHRVGNLPSTICH